MQWFQVASVVGNRSVWALFSSPQLEYSRLFNELCHSINQRFLILNTYLFTYDDDDDDCGGGGGGGGDDDDDDDVDLHLTRN